MKIKRSCLILLVILVYISGCSVKFKVDVLRPAEVNLTKYKKIAIGDIEVQRSADRSSGNQGDHLMNDLSQALFQSGRFEVLDRQNLRKILDEHNFNLTDYADPSTALEMGKIIGPSALIFGQIHDAHFNQSLDKSNWSDPNGKTHTNYVRKGQALLDVSFKVTDLTTGQIVAIKKISEMSSSQIKKTDAQPPNIDPAPLFSSNRDKIVKTFMKVIAPYTETVTVHLKKYGKYPEVKEGIGFAKLSKWDKAAEIFDNALSKASSDPKISKKASKMAKLNYNLGVALLYSCKFEAAKEKLEKSYILKPKTLYKKTEEDAQIREAEYKKLIEQEAVPQN